MNVACTASTIFFVKLCCHVGRIIHYILISLFIIKEKIVPLFSQIKLIQQALSLLPRTYLHNSTLKILSYKIKKTSYALWRNSCQQKRLYRAYNA